MMHKIPGVTVKPGSIAYGLWRFAGTDVKDAQAKLETAIESGFTLIDNADIYGFNGKDGFGEAERLQGQVLQASPGLRDQMIVATKAGVFIPGPYRSDKDYLIKACEDSLQRLNVDVIDLYQIHRPDALASYAEIAEALTILRDTGKIKAAGVSNYTAAQMRALNHELKGSLFSCQPQLSALYPEAFFDGITDYAQEAKLAVLAWSPLAGGILTSEAVAATHSKKASAVYSALQSVAADQEVAVWQVALKFTMMHPCGAVPIIGTQRAERIKKSSQSCGVIITRKQWYTIVEAWLGEPLP